MADDYPAHSAAGPAQLLAMKSEHLLPCVYHFYRNPPQIVSGKGAYLFDHLGRRYLDCYSGVTVMSAGHCNPEIIEPAIAQIRRLQHTTSIYLTEPVLKLAQRLAELTPGSLKRSFFCASGSEAVEGALLLACLHTQRPRIVAMNDSLHGRTRWAMNATGLPMWRTDPFPLPDVEHVPFGDLGALAGILDANRNQIAAVIAEPIQGNGGIAVPSADYWPAVRQLCDAHQVLLILDEVQTGIGRTGRWFACQHWGIVPDIMVLSKALGNGFPISAFITTDQVAASYTRPGASTYGGNPVSAAAALATLDFHERHDLAGRAAEMGEYLLSRLGMLAAASTRLSRPRGKGLMIGVEVVNAEGERDAAGLDLLLEEMKDRGFLCGKTGPNRNVLTLMPPLVVDRMQLDLLLHNLQEALTLLEG